MVDRAPAREGALQRPAVVRDLSPVVERGSRPAFGRLGHVHRFRWAGEDPFSPHNLYACRCGVVRPGI